MKPIKVVFNDIEDERARALEKWGSDPTTETFPALVLLTEHALQKARAAFYDQPGDGGARRELLKAASLAVAALQVAD